MECAKKTKNILIYIQIFYINLYRLLRKVRARINCPMKKKQECKEKREKMEKEAMNIVERKSRKL